MAMIRSPGIQEKQVAMATHQFQHQLALHRRTRSFAELQLHNALPWGLPQGRQRQSPQTMMELLSQGAAGALAWVAASRDGSAAPPQPSSVPAIGGC